MEEYKAHCVRMSLASPPPQELDLRRELMGTALECLVIVKRLFSTICDEEREKFESEAQALSHLILDLQKQPSPKHSWLFTGHETGIANSIISTKTEWETLSFYDSDYERKLACRAIYDAWDHSLRVHPEF